jgi:SAM-dependent methyltransferase
MSDEIERQRRFWNSWNAKYREQIKAMPEANRRQARTVIGWVRALGRTDLDILEIGCGSGWFCRQLAAFGRVTGSDLSDEVLARSGASEPAITFLAGDFFELEFPSSAFDVVVSLEVLAHVGDQEGFVAKIARLLRPGGCAMLATQNRFVLERWSQVPPRADGQIRKWVDARSLRNLLRSRFEIVELGSVVPVGDRGILRWTNAPKFNGLLSLVASRPRIEAAKERLLLGHTLMALARKRARAA